MAKFGFDTSEVDVNDGPSYELLPEGEYTLVGLDAEEKETSTGGEMIAAKFEVVGGKGNGRWVWMNFNIVNKNETAQRIGRQQLVGWATACGKPEADDTDKLLGKKFNAIIGIQKGTGGYKDNNTIKQFLFSEGAAPAAKPSSAPAEKPAAEKPAASSGSNPWD
jgi:hypothetical protein